MIKRKKVKIEYIYLGYSNEKLSRGIFYSHNRPTNFLEVIKKWVHFQGMELGLSSFQVHVSSPRVGSKILKSPLRDYLIFSSQIWDSLAYDYLTSIEMVVV